MRPFLTLLILMLPLNAWAEGEGLKSNKDVIPHLKEIHARLETHSDKPVMINGKKYIVRPGKDGKAAKSLLAGDYRGYFLDRLQSKKKGDHNFYVRDDKSPVKGGFTLTEVPEVK